jgi:hypothetical protein
MCELLCAVDIRAPAEVVWGVLTDLPRFGDWNPFIRAARGDLRAGGSVRVRAKPSIPVPLVFHAQVLECERPHELRWHGHVLTPWLASGEHTFTVEPLATGGVRFVQREVFGGVLPRLAGKLLEREARRGFEAMNRALKVRAEGACSAPQRAACTPS